MTIAMILPGANARHFSAPYERKLIPVAGHFLPREAPLAVVQAIRALGE